MKVEINDPTITAGDIPTCNVTLSTTNRTIRKKISNDTQDLNNTINQPDLTKIHRTYDTLQYQNTQVFFFFQMHLE